jgi:hypothetical protein
LPSIVKEVNLKIKDVENYLDEMGPSLPVTDNEKYFIYKNNKFKILISIWNDLRIFHIFLKFNIRKILRKNQELRHT